MDLNSYACRLQLTHRIDLNRQTAHGIKMSGSDKFVWDGGFEFGRKLIGSKFSVVSPSIITVGVGGQSTCVGHSKRTLIRLNPISYKSITNQNQGN